MSCNSRNLNSFQCVSNEIDVINLSMTCTSDPMKKTSRENSYSEKSSSITDNTNEESKSSEQEKSSTKLPPKQNDVKNAAEK